MYLYSNNYGTPLFGGILLLKTTPSPRCSGELETSPLLTQICPQGKLQIPAKRYTQFKKYFLEGTSDKLLKGNEFNPAT